MSEHLSESTAPAPGRMTAAELRVTREYLGLTGEALATHLDVSSRTVRHWEAGVYAIPDGVAIEVARLEEHTASAVDELGLDLMAMRQPVAFVYRTDDDYRLADPDGTLPASWHRAVVARAAQQLPDVVIDYAPAAGDSVLEWTELTTGVLTAAGEDGTYELIYTHHGWHVRSPGDGPDEGEFRELDDAKRAAERLHARRR